MNTMNMTTTKAPFSTEDCQKILKGKQGTILRDFDTIVNHIQENAPFPLSSKGTAFAMKTLSSLNSILLNPLKTNMKRPVQKSFPHINGLFLLLQLSGLSRTTTIKNKPFLLIDEEVLQLWKNLNPTERYFHLLSVLFDDRAERVLDERFGTSSSVLSAICYFLHQPPKFSCEFTDYKEQERLFIPYHWLALFELFGFLSITHGTPEKDKGWRIIKMAQNTYSHNLFGLLEKIYSEKDYPELCSPQECNNFFQAELAYYFPEWKTSLEVPKAPFQKDLHIFKVSLEQAWRKIAIKGEDNLYHLSSLILDAFDFDQDHLHRFTCKDQQGIPMIINHPCCEESLTTDEVKIGDLNLTVGSKMDFLFDFGDNWMFSISLEELAPSETQSEDATILEKHGQAPKQYAFYDEF
ncbi:MAG: IS1096 element passenger TnpR family protein [Chlamydiota bacterium]